MDDTFWALTVGAVDLVLIPSLVWLVWRYLRGDTFEQRMARAKWWQL